MSDSMPQQMHALNARIKVLEQENALLATQAEDTLLLEGILESLCELNDCEHILEAGLERISLLKDIPYCLCGAIEDDACRIVSSSLSFTHDQLNGQCIDLNVWRERLHAPCYLSLGECAEVDLHCHDSFTANELVLIPFCSRFLPCGLFIFACNTVEVTHLKITLSVLHRCIDAMIMAMDKVIVLDELKNINAVLDQRVEGRTRQWLESEAQYRSLIDQAMDSVFVFSKQGRFLDVNAAACRDLAYSKDELLQLSVDDIIVDRNAFVFNAVIARLESEGTLVSEALLSRKDASTYPVETHLGMILFKGEVRVLAISHDITQRKQIEHSLNQAHAILQGLFDGIPDLIFHKNPQGLYLGCNRAFLRFVGKSSQQDVVGLTDYDLFDDKQADFFRDKDTAMMKCVSAQRNEEWVSYPDGHKVLLDTLKTPYFNPEDGRLLGLIGVSRDITEQRENEEKLLQSQKMEGIGTLVGGIAHDFNNMLAGMMGNLFLLQQDESISAASFQKTERMNDLCERAANMISQLLTFARKGYIQMQPLAFVPFMEEALTLSQLSIPANIKIIQDIECDDQAVVLGDAVQLQQLLLNLLVNARDALQAVDHPCIHIVIKQIALNANLQELYPGLGEGPWLELLFSDNGCGVSELVRDQMFDPFFTTKDVGEGSGLGLSMVYGIVQSHQGAIEIESEEQQGTCFHIYFPLQEEGEPALIENAIDMPHGNGEMILLADDEEIVLSTTASLLTHLGYRVITASSGVEALEKIGDEHIDMALLDVVMPEMGGIELANQLRSRLPDLPILFATAYDAKMVLTNETPLSNSMVMGKPFRLMTLSQNIQQVLTTA